MTLVAVDEKLAKDRRILKAIDTRLSLSLRWIVLILLPVMGVTVTWGSVNADKMVVVSLSLIALLFSAPLMYICVRFKHTYGSGPARWRRMFKALSLAMHAWMGVVIAIFWFTAPDSDIRWIMPLTAGILLVHEIDDWAPYFEHHALQILATWLPLATCLLLNFSAINIVETLMIIAFAGVLLLRTRDGCERFWLMQAEMQQHRYRTSELSNEVNSAQSTSRNQADFLTSITREIRTPMNNVLGALALLDDTEMSSQQRQLQQVALRSGESLLTMTEDIMDFSKIASGNLVLNKSVFNLRKCIENTLDNLGPMAHERKMEILLMIASDLPVRVIGDRQRLMQVLHNLVLNGVGYSGGNEVVVEVQASNDQTGLLKVAFSVRDNGKGISAAQREVMFKAFSSVAYNSADVVAGTGLGLAICSGLVKAMGGEIRVESEPGAGACFHFDALLQVSSQQGQAEAKRNKALLGWRCLQVDIAPLTEKSLRYYLSQWEMRLDSVTGYDMALQHLKQAAQNNDPYHLVIVNCPFENPAGFEFPQWIRDDPKLANVKIMVLGTLAQKGTLGAGYVGVQGVEWVVKPFSHERLHDALSALAGLAVETQMHPGRKEERPFGLGDGEAEEGKQTLLLVEDNKVNQLVARGMLQKLGYNVVIVNNGREAVGILQDRSFDGVLMDCIMPEMDGYEATRAIRLLEKERSDSAQVNVGPVLPMLRIPIIAMTANVGETEKRRCLDAGMDDYLSKPVDLNELETKLQQWLPQAEEKRATTEAVVNMSRRSA